MHVYLASLLNSTPLDMHWWIIHNKTWNVCLECKLVQFWFNVNRMLERKWVSKYRLCVPEGYIWMSSSDQSQKCSSSTPPGTNGSYHHHGDRWMCGWCDQFSPEQLKTQTGGFFKHPAFLEELCLTLHLQLVPALNDAWNLTEIESYIIRSSRTAKNMDLVVWNPASFRNHIKTTPCLQSQTCFPGSFCTMRCACCPPKEGFIQF